MFNVSILQPILHHTYSHSILFLSNNMKPKKKIEKLEKNIPAVNHTQRQTINFQSFITLKSNYKLTFFQMSENWTK